MPRELEVKSREAEAKSPMPNSKSSSYSFTPVTARVIVPQFGKYSSEMILVKPSKSNFFELLPVTILIGSSIEGVESKTS